MFEPVTNLPADEKTALLRQEHYDTTWINSLRETMNKLIDPGEGIGKASRENRDWVVCKS